MRRNGDVASGVGAGSQGCFSIVDWRTLGMLGIREDKGGCGGIKGVVTGDENPYPPALYSQTHPSLDQFFCQGCC